MLTGTLNKHSDDKNYCSGCQQQNPENHIQQINDWNIFRVVSHVRSFFAHGQDYSIPDAPTTIPSKGTEAL
jgi:hypothetical protein